MTSLGDSQALCLRGDVLWRRVGAFLPSLEGTAEEQRQLSFSIGALQELSEWKQLRGHGGSCTALFTLPTSWLALCSRKISKSEFCLPGCSCLTLELCLRWWIQGWDSAHFTSPAWKISSLRQSPYEISETKTPLEGGKAFCSWCCWRPPESHEVPVILFPRRQVVISHWKQVTSIHAHLHNHWLSQTRLGVLIVFT